jgi:hypothetical protein
LDLAHDARRLPARGLSYANFPRTPAPPCSTIYRNGCRSSSKRLRGEARLTDDNIQDALREVRLALLEADVALPVVKDFVAAVKDKGRRRGGHRLADARVRR